MEVLGVEQWYINELPIRVGACKEGVGRDAGGHPHPFPLVLGRSIELKNE